MNEQPAIRPGDGGLRDGQSPHVGRRHQPNRGVGCNLSLLVLLACHLLAASSAAAAAITLTTTLEAEIRNGTLAVGLTILNEGDEAALGLRPELSFAGERNLGETHPKLGPGERHATTLQLPVAGREPGSWPYRLDLTYASSDGVESHAVHVATVSVGPPPASDVAVRIDGSTPLAGSGALHVEVANSGAESRQVAVIVHLPRGLALSQQPEAVEVAPAERRELEVRLGNRSARPGSRLAAFITAEFEAGGVHHTIVAPTVIVVADEILPRPWWRELSWSLAAVAMLVWLSLVVRQARSGGRGPLPEPSAATATPWRRHRRNAIDAVAVLAAVGFVAAHSPWPLLLTATTANGGDMASHYYTAAYLRDVMLPQGRLLGWCPGNYAGFPFLQFYFPSTFVLMVVLTAVMPLQIAFKLVTVLGTLLLPVCAYFGLRLLGTPFPGPALGAVGALCFLFHEANSMWGGNIASTLAGEFTFSLAFALAILFVGTLRWTIRTSRGLVGNGVLVALIGFSHGYALLWAGLVSLLELVAVERWWKRLGTLSAIHGLAILLMAFWLLPLLWYLPWTTAFNAVWNIESWRVVVPEILWPAAGIALLTTAALLVRSWRRRKALPRPLGTWWGALVLSLFFYLTANSFHVVDIRFLPFLQIALCLLAAAGVAHLVARLPAAEIWVLAGLLTVLPFVQSKIGFVPDWMRWNYAGFEEQAAWPTFEKINRHLEGSWRDPRVAWEHSPEHEAFGTIRAFESLPLFSGRSTLEGIYMQASPTAPFIFYLQSEISKITSCPFPQWGCGRLDLARGVEHLRMFNVSQVVLRSPEARAAAVKEPGLEHEASFGAYEIYRLSPGGEGYAVALGTAPSLVKTRGWKVAAYRWFKYARAGDPLPVFAPVVSRAEEALFAAVFDEPPAVLPSVSLGAAPELQAQVDSNRITIEGCQPGRPVLVRVSYHPRWRAVTGERVWLAGPGLMLVFPRGERVELVFAAGPAIITGRLASVAGLGIVALLILPPGRWLRRRAAPWLVPPTAPPAVARALEAVRRADNWPARRRRRVLWAGVGLISMLLVGVALVSRRPDADTLYRQGQKEWERGRYEAAAILFRRALDRAPQSMTAIHSRYYEALAYYEQEQWRLAESRFLDLIEAFPEAPSVAEDHYLVGICRRRLGDLPGAEAAWREVEERFADTEWAVYARQRLEELGAS